MRTRAALVPRLVWNVTTATTATANSGTLHLPLADAYAWIFDSGAGTGTTPTLDFAIQVSPDGGTTWYSATKLTQITTSATKTMIVHGNGPIQGQAAAATAIADTGSAVTSNFPMTDSVRILATIGGTNPSYASIKVWCIPIYQQGRQQ